MRQRTLLIALAVAVFVAAAGIVVALQPDEAAAQRRQIRDWARIGLAAQLEMDTDGMRGDVNDAPGCGD